MFWFQISKFRYLSKLLKTYFHMKLIEFKYIRKVTRLKKGLEFANKFLELAQKTTQQ